MAGFWWTSFLGPRSSRHWRARGRRGLALPYLDTEIRAAEALPAGPEQDLLLQDIQENRNALAILKRKYRLKD
ncbi:hypothetical protein [Arthrobacter sp. lap29]|uniref:hypothetical protein n=1 Tax=Arthrobacter sp. lap29 TaxID=3056122 RepID=UPI0028F6DD15|nr:hypothetical protein [Arthrobacter sp. lap29]